MATWQIIVLVIVIVAAVLVSLYFIGKKLQTKMNKQQSLINQHKMAASILVIDKKKQKISQANLPKVVVDQVPKLYKFRKMPMVKAKIGPQITTLLCDDKIFKTLPTKKVIKVELAGIYIVGYKGTKGVKGKKNVKNNNATKNTQKPKIKRKFLRTK